MVLEAFDEIVVRRPDLHQIAAVPRTAQRDRRLLEEHADVDRLVRLARAAFVRLLDEPRNRRKALGERRLIGQVGRRGRAPAQGEHGHQRQEREATLRAPVTPEVRLGEHR